MTSIAVSAILTLVCATIVALVAVTLILHQEYEDGLVGRLGLCGICLGAIVRGSEIAALGAAVAVPPVGVLIWISLAVFLSRHLYRFLRWHKRRDYDWRPASK